MLLAEAFLLVLCAAIAAVGYGSGLSSMLRIRPNLGDRGILGLVCFGFLGGLLHFLIPLTCPVQLAVLAGGVMVAVISRHELRNQTLVWCAVVVIVIYLLSHHLATLSGDAGLYYLQTMRWITQQKLVAGLGNFHGRLAYNSMIFLIAAIADRSGIGWISNFLIVLFALISFVIRLQDITTEGRRRVVEFWFIVLSMAIIVAGNNHWYGVLVADSFSAMVIIYWTCVALRLSGSSPHLKTDLGMLVLSAVLAVTVKVSAAPLLLPTAALVWIQRKNLPVAFAWRFASISSLVLALWMLRSIALSGCAIYPVEQTRIAALPWAVSGHQVRSESDWIRSWAREPHELPSKVLKDQRWLPRWFSRMRHDSSIRLLMVLAPLGLIAALLRRNFRGEQAHCLLVITIGLVGCLMFWFSTAPDPRFGRGFILAASLLGGSIALDACFNQTRFAVYAPTILLAGMATLSVRGLWRVKNDYLYTVPEVSTYQLLAPNGTRIFVPKGGDRCFYHPLPCTPYFDSAALMRIRWPANLPVASAGWSPDGAVGIAKNLDGDPN
jgi:hypothetical protein